MTDSSDIKAVALEALRVRITRVLPAQIETCLDQLDDAQLWWRPNEKSNSVGNLTLHVCGAVQHFLNRGVGGQEYERDRPAEFSTTSLAKAELVARLDGTILQSRTDVCEFRSFKTQCSFDRTNLLLNCVRRSVWRGDPRCGPYRSDCLHH